jgi:hypothetical protein
MLINTVFPAFYFLAALCKPSQAKQYAHYTTVQHCLSTAVQGGWQHDMCRMLPTSCSTVVAVALLVTALQVTLELNIDKWPQPDRLAEMWTENAAALVQWPLKTVLAGVLGS